MKRLFLTLGVSALMFSGVVEESLSDSRMNENSRLATNGIGPVHIGMTVVEAEQASGRSFTKKQDISSNNASCVYVSANGLTGVRFMLNNGKIVRIDINNPRIMTLRGAKIGNSEARIKKLYPGQIRTTRHKYTDGHYLTFYPKDSKEQNYRLIFETSKGKVNTFRSGKIPPVEYVEGCS